ncbi:variable surface protein, partial [Plasmodium gonderi]
MAEKQSEVWNHLNLYLLYKCINTFIKRNFPSVKFYNMLNEDSMELQKDYLSYCSKFPEHLDEFEQIKKLCSKYITYLKEQDKILMNSEHEKMDCKILTYWLYEQLRITYKMNRIKCTNALNEISNKWTLDSWSGYKSNTYSCKPYVSISSYHDNWEYAKELYDYSIDFAHLNSIQDECDGKCNDVCDYLNKIDKVYESFKDRCSTNKEIICPYTGNLKELCSQYKENICPVPRNQYEVYNTKLLIEKLCHLTPQILDNVEADASQIEQVKPPVEDELSRASLIPTDSQVETELISGKSKSLSVFRNTLLGLVLTSTLIGILYKLQIKLSNKFNIIKNPNEK